MASLPARRASRKRPDALNCSAPGASNIQQGIADNQQSAEATTAKRRRAPKTDTLKNSKSDVPGSVQEEPDSGPGLNADARSGQAGGTAATGGGGQAGITAAAGGSGTQVVLDLGQLVTGQVVKRPSATIKTGYVADVKLQDGSVVLAHAPSLDCAGMIVAGATVYMTPIPPKPVSPKSRKGAAQGGDQDKPKCSHAIQICGDPREGGALALVGCHPQQAEKITRMVLLAGLVPELQGFEELSQQKTVGTMRVDFRLEFGDGRRSLLLEVKNVVCADYPAGDVPSNRPKVGVYTSPKQPYTRTAIFPHGSHKPAVGVVSDRAIKHIHELTQLQAAGEVDCGILFLVNRGDCQAFRPCHEADMLFAQVLRKAHTSGVLVLAYDVDWQGGTALWGKRLPVEFGEGVQGAVDDEHLQRVLHFNATDSRSRWRTVAKAAGEAGQGTKPKGVRRANVG